LDVTSVLHDALTVTLAQC